MSLGSSHLSLRDRVVDAVRTLIVDGELAPGSRLVEENLAQRLGVSRNPLREALQTLAAEGFVRIEPRRGAWVSTVDDEDLRALHEVRETLEVLGARLAAERADDQALARLTGLLDQARSAEIAGDENTLAATNSQLHIAILEAAENPYLLQIYTSMRARLQWIFRIRAATRGVHSWDEHREIVDAIARHDPIAAVAASSRHVGAALRHDAGRTPAHDLPGEVGAR